MDHERPASESRHEVERERLRIASVAHRCFKRKHQCHYLRVA